MFYECPACKTKRPPRIIQYYPPKMVKCIDCSYEAEEEEFVNHREYALL